MASICARSSRGAPRGMVLVNLRAILLGDLRDRLGLARKSRSIRERTFAPYHAAHIVGSNASSLRFRAPRAVVA
jgi:hypothetical protein